MNRTLIWVGIVLFAAGVIVGVMPLSARGVSCGSAFHRSSATDSADYARAIQRDQRGLGLPDGSLTSAAEACDSLRSIVQVPAVVLLVAGGGLAVGVWFVQGRRAAGV